MNHMYKRNFTRQVGRYKWSDTLQKGLSPVTEWINQVSSKTNDSKIEIHTHFLLNS